MGFSCQDTLFGEPLQPKLHASTFLISVLVHGVVCSLVAAQGLDRLRMIERFPRNRFAVRVLDFHSREPQARTESGDGAMDNGSGTHGSGTHGSGTHRSWMRSPETPASQVASNAASLGAPAATRLTPQRMPAPQTLLEPDLPDAVTVPQKTMVPLVVVWAPEKVAPKQIVLPAPDKAAVALARPSLEMPIQEEMLSDLRVSSSASGTEAPAVQPSTTSPVVVHGPEETRKVPQTTSEQPEPPTPSRVLSLSDTRVAEGRVVLPVANQTAEAAAGSLIPGQLKNVTALGDDSVTGKSGDKGEGNSAADRPEGRGSGARIADGRTSRGRSAKQSGGSGEAVESSSTAHVGSPKGGQFGVVVVGSSIAELYPETAEMWSGRIASTVYLRVGQPKNWILQYAVSPLDDAGDGPVDAPWPFEMVRLNLDPGDVDADAIIVHGYVNKDGRFEKLEVVFPTLLTQATMIQRTLSQWLFRPAKQNRRAIAVEILLIIPDQSQ